LSIEERIEIGMPQMALSGLSEGWLLRNLGHLHWRLIADSLEMRPADISDNEGNRLYPTFTRVRFVSSQPLSAYREGENLLFTARLSRHGASFMFSTIAVEGDSGRSVSAELMSTFAHRGAGGGNAELLRSQPAASAHCRAPRLDEMPSFGLVYQERRRDSRAAREVLARAAYDILPQHDINGVGLLYYAAYPLIADICQMRSRGEGPGWAAETSTVERDTCYFANADLTAGLEWVLHRDEDGDGLSTDASIVRDDGVVMASVTTRKAAL
jgi:probable biosynthetic protein (TIGR04098 family)